MSQFSPAQAVEYLTTKRLASIPEASTITCGADDGRFYDLRITVPEVASLTQGDYVTFKDVSTDETWAVWVDIDANGTAPTGALYAASDVQVEVDILSTDNQAALALAVRNAIQDAPEFDVTNKFSISNDATTASIFSKKLGPPSEAAQVKNADDSGAGSFQVTAMTVGEASTVNSTYFQMYSGDNTNTYYVWLDSNSEGVDPTGTGTGLKASFAGEANSTAVATAIKNAINLANSGKDFTATSSTNVVTVINKESGSATDITDGDTGFTFSTTTQGKDSQLTEPSESPANYTNTPTVLTS